VKLSNEQYPRFSKVKKLGYCPRLNALGRRID
jgi:hypothetical protein